MIKSTQTVAVVRRRTNGNDPMGCGLGAGRASELLMLVYEYERRCAYSNTDLLGEEKVAFGGDSDNGMRFATATLQGHAGRPVPTFDLP
jgi:hypothetical protein